MPRYGVLLRAVNVGGRNRLPMAELRRAVGDSGFTEVASLLASGNLAVSSPRRAPAVGAAVGAVISTAFGLDVEVMVRTADELAAALAGVPFDDAEDTYLAFLSDRPAAHLVQGWDDAAFAPDELVLGDGVGYLRYANGAGTTRLTNDVIERRLGVRATTRNWRTTTKLLALLRG